MHVSIADRTVLTNGKMPKSRTTSCVIIHIKIHLTMTRKLACVIDVTRVSIARSHTSDIDCVHLQVNI